MWHKFPPLTDVFVVFSTLKRNSMMTYGCFMVLKSFTSLNAEILFPINETNYSTHMFH